MPNDLSDEELQSALDECAAEPVHIPGVVQPFGCLLGVDEKTGIIQYASENCGTILGLSAPDILKASFQETIGKDVAHALKNAASLPEFASAAIPLGAFEVNGKTTEAHAFASGTQHVVEFEAQGRIPFDDEQALDGFIAMIETIHKCETETELFQVTAELMQQLSGYDRVMIYKFDPDHNGEVITEVKRRSLDPMLGLRFPSYDIPQQARDLMVKLPLRFIEDVQQIPVPMTGADPDLPPLDITFASTRGVSPVHMTYLKNMGVRATLTLSIVIDNHLWGMISCHHRQVRVPAPKLRLVLSKFLSVFTSKLETLQHKEMLSQIETVDEIKDGLLLEIDEETEIDAFFPKIAPTIIEILSAHGVSYFAGDQSRSHGQVAELPIQKELLELAQKSKNRLVAISNLQEHFPDAGDALNELGGALVYAINSEQAVCVFRKETQVNITWAGNPEKTLEVVNGRTRLQPRGSFMTYLEKVSGCSAPWTAQDLLFARRIWTIFLYSSERQSFLHSLTRQQSLMIDELNHRVRNILTLVRSVSQQARRRYGTLDSYSKSIEARIQALASVHDITSGSFAIAIDLQTVIQTEIDPYQDPGSERVVIAGANPFIRAEVAPIFALVIHELTTNAAKYGALTQNAGTVSVDIAETKTGFEIGWKETDGPPVKQPEDRGFGSVLIEQAIPHELGGRSELTFAHTGVEANLFLPLELFDLEAEEFSKPDCDTPNKPSLSIPEKVGLSPAALKGTALVLEDNFVIAKEMGDQLLEFGFADVVKFSNVKDVLEFLENEEPAVAILDVNLGKAGTSEAAALRLKQARTAMIFVTGYGEKAVLHDSLKTIPRLTKPIDPTELKNALAIQLSKL